MGKSKKRKSSKNRPAANTVPEGARPRAPSFITEEDLAALVCTHFCNGTPPARIPELIKDTYGISIPRTAVYRHLGEAAKRQRIVYHPPLEFALGNRVKEKYKRLKDVVVASAPTTEGVAYHAAHLLGGMIHRIHDTRKETDFHYNNSIHLGLAGGRTLRSLCRHFSDYLTQPPTSGSYKPPDDFPSTLYLHALVAGFDVNDPTTEPNAMFTQLYLDNRLPVDIDIRFIALHAPATVPKSGFDTVTKEPSIQTAMREADKIDIVVTSLGIWDDNDSMLRKCMMQSDDTFNRLVGAGIRGDLMWRPVNGSGPIREDDPSSIRAMTVLELSDLNGLVSGNGNVLLAVGPCQSGRTKTDILRMILGYEKPLISHLALDSRTARELVSPVPNENG